MGRALTSRINASHCRNSLHLTTADIAAQANNVFYYQCVTMTFFGMVHNVLWFRWQQLLSNPSAKPSQQNEVECRGSEATPPKERQMSAKSRIALAAVAAALGVNFAATPALASNLQFTFTPSAAVPPLTTNLGTLTADTLQGPNNATITLTSLGDGVNASTSETGTIFWVGATLGGVPLNNLQLAGLNSGGPDNWNLTTPFTATSASAPYADQLSPTGVTLSISYSLVGNGATLLASGSLVGNGALSNTGINPTLAAIGSFNIAPGEGSGSNTFFTSPNPFYIVLGASATSNTQTGNVTSNCPISGPGLTTFLTTSGATCTVTIVGGSTNAGFRAPEPATVGLMGLGLVGLWFSRRKLRS